MKRFNILFTTAAVVLLFACKKDMSGPSVDDNILNYKIEEIPVTQDYTVGAFYYNYGGWNANVKEVPVLGKYAMPSGVLTPNLMAQHIDQGVKAGLDYFIFSYRSPNKDFNNFKSDSTLIANFINSDANGKMKFALQYNFNTGTYGSLSATNPIEKDSVRMEQFYQDFMRVVPFLKDEHCMQVGGKPLLYIQNAQTLFSDNNKKIYDTLRSRLSAQGLQVYIVGMQDRWTPPARYQIRFQGCVDAIYHQSYSSFISNWDRWYLLPQTIDQAWIYSKDYFDKNYGIDYIPNISPAYNPLIGSPTSTNPVYPRSDSGAIFRQLCNVAKKNASSKIRLILIDSWNSWSDDTQLEPAQSYGELYTNIVKQEFKK
ncbi:glycoside hydrolase family 99-like domain-containing protein [Chitinophaga sp. 30R24]|uniref:glycoside hydrolase family 99-like domain-containing protein n=1 Tax=Chitinophaga sp. 30R24 TaxID=3248838 RepID=UPI003B8FC049